MGPRIATAAGAVIVLQLVVGAAGPLRSLEARISGRTVILQTAPVDPYDILAGYFVTVRYQAEQPDPSLIEPGLAKGERVWVTVARDEPAWSPVAVSRRRPPSEPDRVSIAAEWNGSRAVLDGVGRWYVPETAREGADRLMRSGGGEGLAELKVDSGGGAALVGLTVHGEAIGR